MKRQRKSGGAMSTRMFLFSILAASSVTGFHISSNAGITTRSLAVPQAQPRANIRSWHGNNNDNLNSRQNVSRLQMGAANVAAGTGNAGAKGIAVSLDTPLFPEGLFTAAAASRPTPVRDAIQKCVAFLWKSKLFRAALATFCIAFCLSLALRLGLGSNFLSQRLTKLKKLVQGRWARTTERWKPITPQGVEMPFEDVNEGWGICSLKSRKRLGKTQFMQLDFELPKPEYTIPLDLGQQIALCCLDNDGNVARGDFFPFYASSHSKPGSFQILVPNVDSELLFRIGLENANFVRVIKHELKVGDEVALKPGEHRLNYKGQYLPVTDMVYVVYGTGIVSVLDQIRTVLQSGMSSVSSVTVVWMNETTEDFDVIAELLEKEYFKYSDKLAVSCLVVSNLERSNFASNTEINSAVPDFKQGAMAVLGGPAEMVKKASFYLEDRGYPLDTICVI